MATENDDVLEVVSSEKMMDSFVDHLSSDSGRLRKLAGLGTSFIPNGHRLLVEVAEESMTAGGLYVPQTVDQNVKRARVVAVPRVLYDGHGWYNGIDENDDRFPFRIDDEILIDALGAMKVTIDQKQYLLVRCEDVLGTLKTVL